MPVAREQLFTWGRHQVPAAWQRYLPDELLWSRAPDERLATCDACYEVARAEFRADCQCCTYFPQLANFTVGLALRDPHSRDQVGDLIDRGHTLPLGTMASPEQYRRAVEVYARDRFGNEPALVCPFVEAETIDCAIYPYRNSICSTFFCAYDHGDAGEQYWYKVQTFVGHTEIALSQWALDQVGLPAAHVLARLDAWADRVEYASDPKSRGWSEALRRDVWGDWFGRERDLFEACAALLERDGLFEAACDQPFLESLELDRAVRAWLPESMRDSAPEVASEPGMTTPLTTLWYEMQLTIKRLWALPFNEGRVVLDVGALAALDPPRTMTAEEDAVLKLFATPQVLGEQLFERNEIAALEDARGFLAECMRRGVLVVA